MVAQERKQEYFAESEKQRDEAQLLANLGIWKWDISSFVPMARCVGSVIGLSRYMTLPVD
jgi:hypothetical protein